MPFDDIGAVGAAGFDDVTAALRVGAGAHDLLVRAVDIVKSPPAT